MKKKLTILLLALLCLLLAGCSFHNETLDTQMREIVTALNERDEAAFTKLLFMPDTDAEQQHALYTELTENWKNSDPEASKLVSFNINIRSEQKDYDGEYILENGHAMRFHYYEGHAGKGISMISVSESDAYGTATKDLGVNVISGVVSGLLTTAFIVFTVVDIARKKPRKYGWYIALALVHIYLHIKMLLITVPIGSIIWWCIRRSVLQKKEAADETVPQTHTYTDTSRDPWENP